MQVSVSGLHLAARKRCHLALVSTGKGVFLLAEWEVQGDTQERARALHDALKRSGPFCLSTPGLLGIVMLISQAGAGFSSYDGEFRLPLVLAQPTMAVT